MRAEKKAWGETVTVMATPQYSLHFCRAIPGGYCSLHRHRNKINRIYVRAGELIVQWFARGRFRSARILPGQAADAPADTPHTFYSPGGCRFWEAYWPAGPGLAVDVNDIERISEGGFLLPEAS